MITIEQQLLVDGYHFRTLHSNGHVGYSVYDDYAADARIGWMEEIGYPPAKFSEEGFGLVSLSQESRFYREVTSGFRVQSSSGSLR
jgi:acyl-CoA thioesterase FadM